MRNRDILLLGTGVTGAFFMSLGMITMEAPPRDAFRATASPARMSLPPAPSSGWGSWFAAEPALSDTRSMAQPPVAQTAPGGAPLGEAGIWSTPAEFAEPD